MVHALPTSNWPTLVSTLLNLEACPRIYPRHGDHVSNGRVDFDSRPRATMPHAVLQHHAARSAVARLKVCWRVDLFARTLETEA